MTDDGIRMSREELYEMVWAEPMRQLAKRWGVSDVGLAKLCRRNQIPVPGRGYWQRKEYGQTARRPPLPQGDEGWPAEIVITPRPHPSVETQRVDLGIPGFPKNEEKIRVPSALRNPHPLVARSKALLEKLKPDRDGLLRRLRGMQCLDIRIGRASLARALRIMDTLIKALDKRGYPVALRREFLPWTVVEIEDDALRISVEERLHRVDHVLTAEGKAGRSYFSPRYDYMPTGNLSITVRDLEWSSILQRTTDGKKQRLEDCLNHIVHGMLVAAAKRKHAREERERRAKEWGAQQKTREAEEEQCRREHELFRSLETQAETWEKVQRLRTYLRAVEEEAARANGGIKQGSPVDGWLRWAYSNADRLDPVATSLNEPENPEDPNGEEEWEEACN